MSLFEDLAKVLKGETADKSKIEKFEKRREYFRKMGYSGKEVK